MAEYLPQITQACFGLSYLIAFSLEVLRIRWPRSGLRYGGLLFGAAGLFTHTFYLLTRQPDLASPSGSLFAVSWVLAIFYLYGSWHHVRRAWAVFVLPVVLGLVWLGFMLSSQTVVGDTPSVPDWLIGNRFWGGVHGILLLLAAVGVSVGFLASIMYLFQAARLKKKANPRGRLNMLSLERLEAMNRRALNLAFPLLTLGLLLGAVLLKQYHGLAENWFSVKILGTVGLWLVFLVLLYARYAVNVPGRRLARLTLVAFGLLVVVLAAAHPFAGGMK
ncbi:MAG: cytochrome c biogenesis protein [Bacteroidales bacterium]|nr:cytochrome c biogenesis protein [Bacteroidales bacterium]